MTSRPPFSPLLAGAIVVAVALAILVAFAFGMHVAEQPSP